MNNKPFHSISRGMSFCYFPANWFRKIKLICLLVFFGFFQLSNVFSQNSEISMLEFDGNMAIFSVNTTAEKSGDIVNTAIRQLFVELLDAGIEGLDNGNKLMQKTNARWKENFMNNKKPLYMTYVKGYQTEGAPIKNSVGKYEATVLVKINVEFLLRQLKAYGIR